MRNLEGDESGSGQGVGGGVVQQQQQQQQQQHGAFTAQTPTLPRPHLSQGPEPVLYPLASSGRGLLPTPRGIRPQLPGQAVTMANPGAYPPAPAPAPSLTPTPRCSIASYPPPITTQVQHQQPPLLAPSESPQPLHSTHRIRPPYLHPSHAPMPSVSAATGVRGSLLNHHSQPKVLLSSLLLFPTINYFPIC